MAVKVSDLKEQMGVPGPHPILHCECCGAEYSANKGDYFMYPHNHIFKCCDEPMVLALKTTTFQKVG